MSEEKICPECDIASYPMAEGRAGVETTLFCVHCMKAYNESLWTTTDHPETIDGSEMTGGWIKGDELMKVMEEDHVIFDHYVGDKKEFFKDEIDELYTCDYWQLYHPADQSNELTDAHNGHTAKYWHDLLDTSKAIIEDNEDSIKIHRDELHETRDKLDHVKAKYDTAVEINTNLKEQIAEMRESSDQSNVQPTQAEAEDFENWWKSEGNDISHFCVNQNNYGDSIKHIKALCLTAWSNGGYMAEIDQSNVPAEKVEERCDHGFNPPSDCPYENLQLSKPDQPSAKVEDTSTPEGFYNIVKYCYKNGFGDLEGKTDEIEYCRSGVKDMHTLIERSIENTYTYRIKPEPKRVPVVGDVWEGSGGEIYWLMGWNEIEAEFDGVYRTKTAGLLLNTVSAPDCIKYIGNAGTINLELLNGESE